ncbi:MAG: right-handed parallel beta-helix repeat-containing protein [Candidatus Bathyarchaeota archaeon]|nr:right-handed parallel beta-helix repeat-containing protein [Candidatus Bathyarchaeota archaeon]MDH5494182.1 right-handed parallel beta-helix repeat-containing protein [Candidatus Bathyarchaeota archaeon]
MKKKAVLGIMLTLLFIGILSLTFDIQQVEASGTITIKADGSIEGTTDIMTVDNVTYTFTDNINGEIIVERDDIVVDGAGYTLQGTGSGTGIDLSWRSNVTIKNMEIKAFEYGILLSFAPNNMISGNKITAFDSCGIYMDLYAPHNTISRNTITAPSKVERHGIFLGQTSGNNIISGNYIDGFYGYGIRGGASSNNIISGNTIKDTYNGIYFSGGSNNTIYNNNFINHPTDFHCPLSTTLDAGYPLGGNYYESPWHRYNGADLFSGPFQNETGSDGIGDTAHVIDANNTDNYPLMGMFSDFKATSEYHVQIICNSSWWYQPISDFQFNGTAISFNVTGETDTTGFCRICIPRALMNETYQVFVNGTEVQCNLLPCSNTTYSYLYFTYNHSTQEVIIVPEFPTWTSMLLILIVLTAAIATYKRRLLKTQIH